MKPKKKPQIRLYIICWAAILIIAASLICLSAILGSLITYAATLSCTMKIYSRPIAGLGVGKYTTATAAPVLPHHSEYQNHPPICLLSSLDAARKLSRICDTMRFKCDSPIKKILSFSFLSTGIAQLVDIQHFNGARKPSYLGNQL